MKKIMGFIITIGFLLLCTSCGNNHKHSLDKFLYSTVTCDKDGYDFYECSECEEKIAVKKEALGHLFSSEAHNASSFIPCTRDDCYYGYYDRTNKEFDDLVKYTLTTEDIDLINNNYDNLLSELEKLDIYDEELHKYKENSDLFTINEEIMELFNNFESDVENVIFQYQYAQIEYHINMDDNILEDNYLEASKYKNDYYTKYFALFRKIYNSSIREFFYFDYEDEEIIEVLKKSDSIGNKEFKDLEDKNQEIIVQSENITNQASSPEILNLYEKFVSNNNQIANLYGYDNYMEYAFIEDYSREYTYLDSIQVGNYIKEYITPLYKILKSNYDEYYNSIEDELDNDKIADYLNLKSESFFNNKYVNNLVNNYFSNFDNHEVNMTLELNKLIEKGNYFMISYPGAYEWYLEGLETPIVCFSEDYQTAFTFVHEFGHYMNNIYNEDVSNQSYDLLETHSTGNEMLFLSYLKNHMNDISYQIFLAEYLINHLTITLISAAVNEFEVAVYLDNYIGTNSNKIMADNQITKDEYDYLFESILTDYGLSTMYSYYWRLVAIRQPAYYISYSISAVTSLQLFINANNKGFDSAINKYINLITYTDEYEDLTYEEVLLNANMYSYNDEELYQLIFNSLKNEFL